VQVGGQLRQSSLFDTLFARRGASATTWKPFRHARQFLDRMDKPVDKVKVPAIAVDQNDRCVARALHRWRPLTELNRLKAAVCARPSATNKTSRRRCGMTQQNRFMRVDGANGWAGRR
jgi:hypothetical protein